MCIVINDNKIYLRRPKIKTNAKKLLTYDQKCIHTKRTRNKNSRNIVSILWKIKLATSQTN